MGKTKAPLRALPAAAVVLLALVSCGVPPATTPANETTTPTAACPSAGTEPRHANCFAYDGDAAMAQNEMYRQRRKLSPDVQSQLEQHIEPAKTALSALPQPVTANEIETAFEALGLREVQTDDGGNGVRFGVAVPSGGCIYGVIPREGELTLQAGGSIMDGGCLEMFGH
ncbi:hypothetical protein ACIPY2_18585 [Paenarthrobacter sp. NPDC089675]|uniref:hypothetical protein n=1 Tax=Paenarthrobacter sp. NPDC089675 TaxID=3364376 RepID=UPI00380A54CA